MATQGENVERDDMTAEQRRLYERRMRDAMPNRGAAPYEVENLIEMWEESKTRREMKQPTHWREENTGRYPAIGAGTKLRCICGSLPMGSHRRGLQLPQSHGVFLSGCAAAHERDRDVGDDANIRYFGVCSSVHHPLHINSPIFAKFINMFKSKEKIILQSESDPSQNVKGYECMPQIVGDWENPYDGLRIASNASYHPGVDAGQRENFPTVTYESFLVCLFGGIIEPEYPSNTEIDLVTVQK